MAGSVSLIWAAVAVIVLLAVLAATRLLRRLVLGFAVAAGLLLAVHFQTNPAEAATAGAAMLGGLIIASPLRGLLLRLFF